MENEKHSSQVQPNFDKWVIAYNDIVEDGAIRFNSLFSMPKLQFISSVHLVVPLWYNKLRMFKHELTYSQVFKIGDEIKNELDDVVKAKPLHQYFLQLIIQVGEELRSWISMHDKFVFKNNEKKKSVAINYIDKIVWSPRGTINYLKTAKSLLEVKKSILYKNCVIVCAKCCASEEPMIGHMAFYKYNLHSAKNFWFNIMNRSVESWGQLKANKCLYCYGREVSAYLKKKPAMVGLQMYNFPLDYSCYIVSSMNKNQQNDSIIRGVFTLRLPEITMRFLLNPHYHDYFLPSFYHIRKEILYSDVRKILFALNNLINDHHYETSECHSYLYEKYVFFFQEIWSSLTDMYEYVQGNYWYKDRVLNFHYKSFDWIWQNASLHLLTSFFADCNMKVKRKLMFYTQGINFCEKLIINDQFELFEKYVCPVFFAGNTEESHHLKQMFVRKLMNAFWYFIKARNWSALDKLFIWSYSSETERMEQKKMLLRDVYMCEVDDYTFTPETQTPYQSENNCKPMNGVTNLDHLDELLKYCFDSKKEIDEFKRTELCKTNNFTKIICDMKKCKRPDVIKHFLSWCFSNNKKLIRQFEENFSNQCASLEESVEPRRSKRRRLA